MISWLYLGGVIDSVYVQRLCWIFVYLLQVIRMELILFVVLLKSWLFLCWLGLAYKLMELLFVIFSILMFDIAVVFMNSLILLKAHLVHLLSFSLLFGFNSLNMFYIWVQELFVFEIFHIFILWLSSEILLDLLFILVDEVDMNGFWDFLFMGLYILMILMHFVDILKLLFLEL